MEKATIVDSATKRRYAELEKQADEFIKTDGWEAFMSSLRHVRPEGKARDAVVELLQLHAVGGTDSDIFREFGTLEGNDLHQIRANAADHAIIILKDQISSKHTYFLDIEAMTMTPYVVLVKDVIEARKREIEQLKQNPSRIDVLGTYYGFQILMTDNSMPFESPNTYGYRRWRRTTWLNGAITETAANAIKNLTSELSNEVDMDMTYKTLQRSSIFRNRCTQGTADILANAVRVSLYKVPGNRSSAASALGHTGDSRVLPFLHHRLPLEQSRYVRISIARALGTVGHESSIEVLKERAIVNRRYMSKEAEAMIDAIGRIYSPQCNEILTELLKHDGNTIKAAVIQALSKQDSPNVVELISPYLVHRTKPVVRASVFALSELGNAGTEAIIAKATNVIKKIGYDRLSINAFRKLLEISAIAEMPEVHQYFAGRVEKLGKELKRMRNSVNNSFGYYWRRWEARVRTRLVEYCKLASTHLRPPFHSDLINSMKSVFKDQPDLINMINTLGRTPLIRAINGNPVMEDKFEQTYLPSF
ncbi:MAG: HEAT repeat domain-containing protein, partial [Candidatus Thorarchaeota archaeon]